ncbi:hypothetical protein [Microterricola pindariensis]|uniref:hypothetical protein n=1 Tax=Microterricola pindariensis TaxID=478010 RepID=UPI0010572DFC|nr:hypothetical protein [Microterricola pindariensis]
MPKPESLSARSSDDAEELWLRVLTELEAELEAPVELDDDSHAELGMWSSPTQLPVLPASLRDRADALHRRQRERETELVAERTQVLRHLEALRAVPRPRAAASVYLDVSG